MMAYRMYNQVTDYSFRVRPLTVNYIDADTGNEEPGRFAFVIEDGGVSETATKTIPILLQTVDLAIYPEGGSLVAGF